jgi:hypothetical protein
MRESRILSRFAVATIGVLAVTVGVATQVFAAGTWGAQTSGTSNDLAGVCFVDANHGWAVGQGGRILAFVNAPPSGTLTTTPSSGPPGTVISADSVTPCPSGSTRATISFKNSADVRVASEVATAVGTE